MLVRIVAAFVVAAMAVVSSPGPATAVGPRTVRLFPVQTAPCDAMGLMGAKPVRRLVVKSAPGTPCPSFSSAEMSLRADERYTLADRIAGRLLPGPSSVTLTLVFEQPVGQPPSRVETHGYVNASVKVLLNGVATEEVRTSGPFTPTEPHRVKAAVPVPSAVRGKAVAAVALLIIWQVGTTPGVQPDMDGRSSVAFPVYTLATGGVAKLAFEFVPIVEGTGPCPKGAPPGAVCWRARGDTVLRGQGRAVVRYKLARWVDGTGSCNELYEGTIDVVNVGTLSFTARRRAPCSDVYGFKIVSGTRKFQKAKGSGTITVVHGSRPKWVWRGEMIYGSASG